jgi:hypothetical protein
VPQPTTLPRVTHGGILNNKTFLRIFLTMALYTVECRSGSMRFLSKYERKLTTAPILPSDYHETFLIVDSGSYGVRLEGLGYLKKIK